MDETRSTEEQPLSRSEKIIQSQISGGMKPPIPPSFVSGRIHGIEDRLDALEGGAGVADSSGISDQINELFGLIDEVNSRLDILDDIKELLLKASEKPARGRPKKAKPKTEAQSEDGQPKGAKIPEPEKPIIPKSSVPPPLGKPAGAAAKALADAEDGNSQEPETESNTEQ